MALKSYIYFLQVRSCFMARFCSFAHFLRDCDFKSIAIIHSSLCEKQLRMRGTNVNTDD